MRVAFVLGALVYALTVGGTAFVVAAAVGVIAVRAVPLPALYDGAFVIAMVLVGVGEALRVYELFALYDAIAHAIVPFLVAPVIYLALSRLDVLPDPAQARRPRRRDRRGGRGRGGRASRRLGGSPLAVHAVVALRCSAGRSATATAAACDRDQRS